jgi:transposase
MQLEDAEADASEDELAAERAMASITVKSFERKRPARKPFPEHLPRERVVVAAPMSCPCCGSTKLSKLGEEVIETLEVVPRRWKVIQTVRERFSCRQCETITQPPAPFHVTPRGFAGPSLLAMILFDKFVQHQPVNRQSERYARQGVELSLSTLADQVGACAAALKPLHALIEAHVLSAERLHGDDTTVPILAKAARILRRRCSTRRAIGRVSIPSGIWLATSACCRPTRSTATTGSISRTASPAQLSKLFAGPRAAQVLRACRHCSQRAMRQECAADLADRITGHQTNRRTLRKSSARSTACRLPSAWPRARKGALPSSPRSKPGCVRNAPTLAPRRGRQGDRLHAHALGSLHPIPR